MGVAGWRPFYCARCLHSRKRTDIDLLAAIVMPDHAHMIFVPRTDQKNCEIFPLARITKAIKGSSSHLIKQQFKRTEAVWQEESFDHVLRSSEKLDEKISYILYNPVRSGLVSRPEDYRWLWARPELIL
ncbi:MAG: transposase [Acidobacteriales bacterium]|nr:transposase [Terriglobales bacterium]